MGRQRLPVIVGFGGVNGAGRASGHHALGRMAYSALPEAERGRTRAALARLDVVSREEFDAQAEILKRTRTRVRVLEAELEALTRELEALEKHR